MGVLTGPEADLRQSVLGDLTASGVLSKLRAQLRHHVFESLSTKAKGAAPSPQGLQSAPHDPVVLELVHDVLLQYHLDYSAATFRSECGLTDDTMVDRTLLCQRLEVKPKADRDPVLSALLKKKAGGGQVVSHARTLNPSMDNPLARKARRMFDAADLNKDGVMSKDELRHLFQKSFSHFNEAILERYVNEEFRSSCHNFSGDLGFDEFLSLYSRIFIKIDNHDGSGDDTAPSGVTAPVAKFGALKNTKPTPKSSVTTPQEKATPPIKTKGALDALSDSEDDDIDDLIDSFSNEMSTGSQRQIRKPEAKAVEETMASINDTASENNSHSQPAALSATAKDGPKPRSFFSDTDSEDDASSVSAKPPSVAAKPTETAKSKTFIDSESDLEDIEESIDDGDISTDGPSDDDDEKDKGIKGPKKNHAYSNDFSDDGEDSASMSGIGGQSSAKGDSADDMDQEEIDAVSDVSVDFSDEITNHTDDKSAISADDQFDYEEDADDAF